MSQKGIEQLIGKALIDKKFLEEVMKNPEAVIRSSGLDVSAEELSQIKKVDSGKAKKLAEMFAGTFATRQQAAY